MQVDGHPSPPLCAFRVSAFAVGGWGNRGTRGVKKHYLNRVPTREERRKWYRRPTDLLVRLLYMAQGIRQTEVRISRIVDLSEGGAKIEAGPSMAIPDHFYIILGEFDFFVGCVVVGRTDGFLHVSFLAEAPTRLINRLSRLTNPEATLERLGPDFDEFKGNTTIAP